MATISRENVGVLNDKVTVTITKNDYYPAYEKSLKNYTKQANIPGFRKGMVPVGHIKKMYGASIFSDEILRAAEKEMNAWLEQEKPDIFAQPLPTPANADTIRQLDLHNPGDYNFEFEIGLKPLFELPDLSTATINKRSVQVTPEMIDDEVSHLQSRFGDMTEPETVGQDKTVLNLKFTELDEQGLPLEGGIEKDNSLLLSYFAEAVRPQWQGLKVGDSLVFSLADAFETKERDWLLTDLGLGADDTNRRFLMTITKLGFVELKPLGPELYEAAFAGKGIETEDAFREAVKQNISQYWSNQAEGQVNDEIYHYLLDHTAIQFPEGFLKRWLQTNSETPKSAEEVEQEFPGFVNGLKWTLIGDKIAADQNIQISNEELKQHARNQMLQYMGMQTGAEEMPWLDSYVERMMGDRKFVDRAYHELFAQKLFDWARTQVTNYKIEEMSAAEFTSKQHHHHH